MANIVEFKNVNMSFGNNKVLKDIDLEIEKGKFYTLLGPSGCGKSTILKLIGGFLSPTSGDVLLDGKVVNDLPANKRHVNTVFQDYALFPHMNVFENVAFGLKIDPELQWREWTNKFEMVEGGFNNEEYRKNILAAGFVERPMDLGFDGIQPRLTMILPLKDEGKGIVETFNKKERYKVNVAKKQGVVCYKGTLEDMPIYDELNKITAERDQYVARSIEYLTTMYQHLHPRR